jgi:hypothetical protein
MAFKHPKVMHWDDERSFGNGFMVTTSYGWAFDPDPDHNAACHVRGFDTARDARAELKWVQRCSCLRCATRGHEDERPKPKRSAK